MSTSWRFAVFWLSALVVATALLYTVFRPVGERAFEDAALGDQTRTVIGILDGDRVHCFTLVDGPECLGPAKARDLERRVLWLGNSQLHSINNLSEGDVLSSVLLARALRPTGTEMLTFSQPNANLQEHLVLFEALASELEPNLLLIPAVFDDTREGQLRPDIRQSLRVPDVAARLEQSLIGRKILHNRVDSEGTVTSKQTLQERSEAAITEALEAAIGWEDLRARARGSISLALYKTRNTVFGITPNSVRRKISGTYADNMAALEQIVISASEKGITVLLYVPPLRSDVARPYDPDEYAAFKSELAALADRHGARFANLEGVVPGPLWGTKASTGLGEGPEYDFMHFQGRGHSLLAEALLGRLKDLLDDL